MDTGDWKLTLKIDSSNYRGTSSKVMGQTFQMKFKERDLWDSESHMVGTVPFGQSFALSIIKPLSDHMELTHIRGNCPWIQRLILFKHEPLQKHSEYHWIKYLSIMCYAS